MLHEMQNAIGWIIYNKIDKGRKGRKPGYIHEIGSHDLSHMA